MRTRVIYTIQQEVHHAHTQIPADEDSNNSFFPDVDIYEYKFKTSVDNIMIFKMLQTLILQQREILLYSYVAQQYLLLYCLSERFNQALCLVKSISFEF